MWGIAEAHLGNGLRWREITDAEGLTLATGTDEWVDVGGRMVDEPQARLIFPGQHLFLPPDAVGQAPVPGDPPPAPHSHGILSTAARPDSPPRSCATAYQAD